MNKINLYFILLIASVTIISCHKDDGDVAPPRDRSQQYADDIAAIETYLQTHYITTTEVNGQQDVVIDTILSGSGHVSIWNNTEFPLKFKTVKNDIRDKNTVDGISKSDTVVNYKMYYLIINQVGGQN